VDDNATVRLILRENLISMGAVVIEAENGEKCLEADAGCTDYLSKPLKKAVLLEKILEF